MSPFNLFEYITHVKGRQGPIVFRNGTARQMAAASRKIQLLRNRSQAGVDVLSSGSQRRRAGALKKGGPTDGGTVREKPSYDRFCYPYDWSKRPKKGSTKAS